MTDVLESFHRALVEEILAQRPDYLDGPFTVAEIYQNLVPYGTHRDRIGVEMNGDYEDALLRLLAGEGGYLVLDSEHALRELREELETSNPNTGVYREFAAVDVRLNPEKVAVEGDFEASSAVAVEALAPDTGSAGDEAIRAEEAASAVGDDEGPASFWSEPPEENVTEDEKRTDPLAVPESLSEGGSAATEEGASHDGAPSTCRWCRAELPDRPNLNFCPFCGTDIRLVPCPSCGEELQPGWRFCVACGTEVEG